MLERNVPSQPEQIVDTEVVILGAGPAGLAVGACLRRQGIPFLILEQDEQVASSWRRHYHRLHLHTDKARSALPHLPFPRDYGRYPSRSQMIAYLEAYAAQFALQPRFGQEVIRACRQEEQWQTWTADTRYRSRALVVATGNARQAVVPAWPGQDRFQGEILHSSQYRDGEPFAGQRVLVVGMGNSGGEIAVDLWEHGAQPALAVRRPVNVLPRDLFGLPLLAISIPLSTLPAWLADLLCAPILRWKFGRLSALGLHQAPYGPFTQIERDGRIPLIDAGTVALLREKKAKVYPGIHSFTDHGVRFTDGRQADFAAVVLATGYRPAVHTFLEPADGVADASGVPATSGAASALPGLYFCGFTVSARGVLNDIAHEARQIAAQLAA